jgi:hypothetical protein
MLEDGDLLFLADLMKVIHIQLSHEGRKLFMLKVFGEDLILEEFFILDDKAITTISPFDYMAILLFLQDAVGFYDKIGDLLFAVDALLVSSLFGFLLTVIRLVLRELPLTLVVLETYAVL